uniref:G_PROTEIN_RECEP_F1_2 domain-containing protein n=1 Tax=Globodera pallida TaxID=36090 RepID=A0A183CJQ9_GLOPA
MAAVFMNPKSAELELEGMGGEAVDGLQREATPSRMACHCHNSAASSSHYENVAISVPSTPLPLPSSTVPELAKTDETALGLFPSQSMANDRPLAARNLSVGASLPSPNDARHSVSQMGSPNSCFAKTKLFYEHSPLRHFAPFLLLIAYALFGALLFFLLENEHERRLLENEQRHLDALRSRTLQRLEGTLRESSRNRLSRSRVGVGRGQLTIAAARFLAPLKLIPGDRPMNDEICLPYELLRLHGSPLEGIFFTFLFPWLFLFGLVGNCLNLASSLQMSGSLPNPLQMVLLNLGRGSIRRRSDSLLIALAFCDVLFLLLLLPSAMAQFDSFGQNPRFRLLYLSLRVHLVALANWCSAVAIWLIIAICADRLLAIRSSLRLHSSDSSQWAIIRLVFGIVLLSGLLTSYNHFSYHCVLKFLCGHSQVIGKCFNVLQESWPGNHTNLTPHPLRAYVRWSMAANALLVIVLPVLLMLFLNASLLVAVRRNSFHLQCPKKSVADRKRRGEEMRNGAVLRLPRHTGDR